MIPVQKGFIPVMLTPFKKNGEIDYDALTRLTELYLGAGAAGLFANCLSSEMYELTGRERLSIVRHIVKVAGGTVPVVATGTFGGTIEEQADFVKQVYNEGPQAVILITSLLANADEPAALLDERLFQLLGLTDNIPLGFYECPLPYKRVLLPEQLGRFVSTGRVIYHKDTCLDIEMVRQKLKAVQGYDFGLYDAYMPHAVASLKAGSAGLSCIQGNFSPELIVWLCKNYNDPSCAEAVEKIQQFFTSHMDVMHHLYPLAAKHFLQKRGLDISAFTRRQVGIYTAYVKDEIEKLYEEYERLQAELGIKTPALQFNRCR